MPGTENDAAAYRDAGLSERLGAAGWNAIDEGDLEVPSYLPHPPCHPCEIGRGHALYGICSWTV